MQDDLVRQCITDIRLSHARVHGSPQWLGGQWMRRDQQLPAGKRAIGGSSVRHVSSLLLLCIVAHMGICII